MAPSRSGGTGRRAGLKIRFPSGSVGSIPTFGIGGIAFRFLESVAQLTVVDDGMQAEALCGLLRSSGVACNHRPLDTRAGALEALGTGGPHEVLVAPGDLERAREILDSTASG